DARTKACESEVVSTSFVCEAPASRCRRQWFAFSADGRTSAQPSPTKMGGRLAPSLSLSAPAYGQLFEFPTHCLTFVDAEPVQGVWFPLAQLALTPIVWQRPSSARNEKLLAPVPLVRATRASSAAPPARNVASDWPSTVHVNPQVRPATEAV